jgi:hypothetical protein
MCHCGFCGAGENLVEIEPDDLEIGPCLDFRLLLLHATTEKTRRPVAFYFSSKREFPESCGKIRNVRVSSSSSQRHWVKTVRWREIV